MRMQFYSMLVAVLTGLAPMAGAQEFSPADKDVYRQAISAFGVSEEVAAAAAEVAVEEIARRAQAESGMDIGGTTPEIALSDNPYSLD